MAIDRVDARAELLRQDQGLAARAAPRVHDDVEAPGRQETQHVAGLGVAARAELCHPAEEQIDRIVRRHLSPPRPAGSGDPRRPSPPE